MFGKIRNKLKGTLPGVASVTVLLLAAMLWGSGVAPLRAQFGAIQTWLGTSGGTANAAIASIHNVGQLSDLLGVPLKFFPGSVNTGATTITLNLDGGGSLGPVNILKQVPGGGLASFVGSEFQTTQVASIMYDGTQFECLSCAPTFPSGFVQDYTGLPTNIPAGWLKADGSAINRTTYAGLFNAISNTTVSANTTNTNATVTVSNGNLYQIGWYVGGANVPCNATITATGSTTITLSSAANASGATTLTIGPYPQGDCSTTFNLPNLTGRITAGVDGSTNITSATCANAGSLGASCGAQTQTLSLAQLPGGITSSAYNTITVTSSTTNVFSNPYTANVGTNGTFNAAGTYSTITSTGSNLISVTSNNTGGGSHPILPPVSLVYKIIKT